MALQFDFMFIVVSDSDAQVQIDVQWIATNYGTEVIKAWGGSTNKVVEGTLRFTSFNDLWAAILAFKTEFTTTLTLYDFEVTQEPA